MPVKEEKLRKAITKLLKGADLESLTVTKVKRSVEEKLGLKEGDLDGQTSTVRAIVTEIIHGAESESGEEAEDKTREKNKASPKQETKEADTKGTQQSSETKKRKLGGNDSETKTEERYIPLGNDLLRVTPTQFKDKPYVDIRRYYKNQNSAEVAPTPKGIALKLAEWETLKAKFKAIDALIHN